MTLSKLQAAYRKELNKSVKKGDKLKQQKVVYQALNIVTTNYTLLSP